MEPQDPSTTKEPALVEPSDIEQAAVESTPEESPAVESTPSETNTPAKKSSRAAGLLLDFVLVGITASLIAGSAYYLHKQLKQYHIPTALEMAMTENTKLSQLQRNLEEQAFRADQQSRLNQHFSDLQDQLAEVEQSIKNEQTDLAQAKNKILALQHQIRQSDRDARSISRNQLMPGMMLGVVKTKRGQVYNGAIIRGIDGKKITIRHDAGQARFNLNLLVTDNLPPIARYGLGLDDLVDMSDFQSTEELDGEADEKSTSATKKKKKAEKAPSISTRKTIRTRSYASYAPKPGLPVVDTTRQQPSSGTSSPAIPSNTDAWDAPDAPLPL